MVAGEKSFVIYGVRVTRAGGGAKSRIHRQDAKRDPRFVAARKVEEKAN